MPMLFLDFLAGLPEEQVGTDRRAQDRDHGHGVGGGPLDVWNDQGGQRLAPRHARYGDDRDIGKQRKGRPLQDRRIALIVQRDLDRDAHDPEQQGVERRAAADQKLEGRAHGAEVRTEVDDIGDQQQQDDSPEQGARIVPTQVPGNSGAGDPADLRGDLLDHHHQREADDERPDQAVPEFRADLAMRADPAGVIIRGARDQARA